ncbi:MAG: ABC transporter ATP-binding protein [Clostridia bacterium]|nr:ABC transporter ATP-binding protein [Clostridia bacterium]
MWKLKKYLKPFIFPLLVAIVFLYIQAICKLNLPNYMSDIVNVGIQSNGIENAVPEAISENGMSLIKIFVNDDEKQVLEQSYELVNSGDSNYIAKYPESQNTNIYVLKQDADIEKLDNIFKIADRTFINIMTSMAQGNESQQTSIQDNTQIDFEKIYNMIPILQNLPQEQIESARQDAVKTDDTMLSQVAVVFTKLFYQELGMDLSKIQTNYIILTGTKMLGMTLIVAMAAIIVSLIATRVSARVGQHIRIDLFKKVQEFAGAEFEKFSTSSLITRTTNDVTQIQNLIVMGIRLVFFAPVMGIGALIMILQRNVSMTWILGLAIAVIIALIIVVFLLAVPKFKIIQKLIDKLNLVSRENISGIMVSRAFRTQKYEEDRFDSVNTELTKINLFVNRIMVVMMPAMTLVMNGVMLLIVWIGAKQIAESNLQIGDMMAFMQYAMHVIMSFLFITMIFITFPRAEVSAKRISEVLETDVNIKNPEKPEEFKKDKIGYVEFKDVSFKYDGADEYVLENISFIAKPGETTAFIGSTGSGKSTLIKLVPRFNDATDGEVLVNGVNVKSIDLEELQKQIGYVPQKGSLLSGTIESNIKYGAPELSDDEMEKYAGIAQASEFIESKDNKYQSEISQNAKNVSGGQKQRLSIARALAKNAPIYIFDDSFSALDFKTDANLRQALKENMKNATILIVAQRVSTIMNAEQIIVLDKGKIVGKGTHKELLEKCPTYYEIASSQLTKEEL